MKKLIGLLICTLISLGIEAQSIVGAWENYTTPENGDQLKTVVIFTESYQVATTYDATTGKFIHSNGGSWSLKGDMLTETVEFDSDNSKRVGTKISFKVSITETTIEMIDSDLKFNRIDNGEPGKLQGAWLMSGRVRNGETQTRDTSRPRKTMKILSGTRFQWIAYNTETKQFMGTGGGTYTTINGEYTENIEFFSKDDSRAGASLKFNYKLTDGDWNHTGFSSKGDPLNEIWSLREQ
ncbi:membrane or secreted protein [Winogradskyella psychrotolerans]|uniref:membrane or secreted protein n=1 Tax=Winogradskyella psychrotolerans TaxID=1344585 RepID=UPI001C066ED7|nr:membrane or secreted protein [Winogradskyella psychrotolerans]MBU2926914.1 membrane or secreted protein [Winogradskyella psychrotolerans]